MGARPKRQTTKKKSGRRTREPDVYYVVAIEDWDWSYLLSLNTERDPSDPYHEFRHLQLRGRLLYPKGLKTDRILLTLLPSRGLNSEVRKALRPHFVGSLEGHSDPITGLISLPEDALPPILQMLIADRFKFFVAHGTSFSRRRAALNGFRLEAGLDPDDFPAGIELPD